MESAVMKFIEYLEEYKRKQLTPIIIGQRDKGIKTELSLMDFTILLAVNEETIINNLQAILKVDKSAWKKSMKIFNDFSTLSKYLLASPLTDKERAYIVFCLIEKNIVVGLFELMREISCNDFIDIKSYCFRYIDESDKDFFIKKNGYYKFLNTPDEKLSEDDRKKKAEMEEFIQLHNKIVNNVVKNHLTVKEHYIDKKDTYGFDDIEIVMNILQTMRVSEELCKDIVKVLKKDLCKRKSLEEKQSREKQVTEPVNTNLYRQAKTTTEAERKVIYKQLFPYFDLKEMKPKRFLNEQEIIECIRLFQQLHLPMLEIEKMLTIIDKENKNLLFDVNPIELYNQLSEKLAYYDKGTPLKECMGELFIASSEDYQFWRQLLQEELQRQLASITTHEYEIKKAQKVKKSE